MSRGWRSAPLPPGWDATRGRILARDDWTCGTCGGFATDVDHIIPTHQGGPETDDNLAAMCRTCHRRKTAAEAVAERKRRRAPRPTPPHPGFIDRRTE